MALYEMPCHIFRDGEEWIVFAPASRVVMRTNAAGAARFSRTLDRIETGDPVTEPGEFAPTRITLALSSRCAQRCIYCYGMPAHENTQRLDFSFARRGLQMAASNAAAAGEKLEVLFHGLGEPTMEWKLLKNCIGAAREAAAACGIRAVISLCTGGQLRGEKAGWLVDNVDRLMISIDGPPDIHLRQRPRRDGKDSLEEPLALARRMLASGGALTVMSTITEDSVGRMGDIVRFVAGEIGPVRLDLGMVFTPEWVDQERVRAPAAGDFITNFARALSLGETLGVDVGNPNVSIELLLRDPREPDLHVCLTPPALMSAYYDVPREQAATPAAGVFGRKDPETGEILIDAAALEKLREEESGDERCRRCPARAACMAPSGVRGRMPDDEELRDRECRVRVGVLEELLRRGPARREVRYE